MARKKKRETPSPRSLRKGKFLAAYAETGNISLAADAAGVDRSCHYEWKRTDPVYRDSFRHVHARAMDMLEAEARRRAVAGVQRLKFHEGLPIMLDDPSGERVERFGCMVPKQVPYVEHQYSDVLLMFLLKAGRPKKFRENIGVEHKGEIKTGPLTGENTQLPTREELLKRYLELAKKMPGK